ncbi:MAG: hypothetical protein LUO99_01465 [Methanomicrobiales archaeon]|nr:hypothetical protein [Methanomicrobiales archaeon]
MRTSAFISVSAGILLVLLLLSSGCGERPSKGDGGGGFQPFWESTPAPTTQVSPTPDVGSVVEITYEMVTITPQPTPTEIIYVEVLNKEYLFKANTTALEYQAEHAPLLIDVTLKPNIVSRGTVERDPTCTPTEFITCLRPVTATYPDPTAWFSLKVINTGTGQIVAQDGYGREYDVSEQMHITAKSPGMYRIEMTGNRLSAVVRLRVAT